MIRNWTSATMPRNLLTLSAVVCLFGAILFLANRSSQVALPIFSSGRANEPFSLAAFYTLVPYSSSWRSWWHAQRHEGSTGGVIEKGWNLLYHLGGNGPWIEKVDGVVDAGVGPPEGCRVEQVHMVSVMTETPLGPMSFNLRYPSSIIIIRNAEADMFVVDVKTCRAVSYRQCRRA